MAKETVYIEADDEITTVIDKVMSAKDKIVAIVLPKRATVFQSVVNMKLLKKAALESKKQVVLIASDSSIDQIAAVAGLHVAQSLSSKPVIPKRKNTSAQETVVISGELDTNEEDTEGAKNTDTGPEITEPVAEDSDDETIELDNTVQSKEPEKIETVTLDEPKKKKRMMKIPDFSSFRLRTTLLITAIILLVAGWYVGFMVMPRATITITTDTSTTPVAFDFIVRTGAQKSDIDKGILPATAVDVTKENKVTAQATGEKNIGEKATGEVAMTARVCGAISTPSDVAAGTGVSVNGKTYITQSAVSFAFSSFNGTCLLFAGSSTTIVAQDAGEAFNVSDATFAVNSRADVSASGSATGGTTNKVKVVSADDIQKAKDQLKGSATADATNELKQKLTDNSLQALADTFEEGQPKVIVSAAVDSQVADFTVTQTVAYRMLGISSSELGSLLDARVKTALGTDSNKNIRSNGLDKATYRLAKKTSFEDQTISLQSIAVLGPTFDEAAIKNEVAGKKRGDIEKLLESRDGVRSVSVEYNPFWVMSTPKKVEKITIVVNELETAN